MKDQFKRYMKTGGAALAIGAASITTAHADVPEGVTAALGGLPADISAVGSLMLIAAATAVTFKWLKGGIFG